VTAAEALHEQLAGRGFPTLSDRVDGAQMTGQKLCAVFNL
jgi:hypothetical protein